MRPLTRRRSAALLPVAGRPIVEYVLEHLVRYGVDTATVALHHEASQIERLLGDGTRAGLRLDYALERVPLGTGGAPRRVAAGWREPFVLAAAVREAERIFQEQQARGATAFRVAPDKPAERIDEFDPRADEIIMVPRVAGG